MSIKIGIFDIQRITLEAISNLLSNNNDFFISFKTDSTDNIDEKTKKNEVNILIINIHSDFTKEHADLIKKIRLISSKTSILVLSASNDENIVFNCIKAGAKGFLSKESTFDELTQALYTIRNGHDYFSRSISDIIIKDYLKKLNEKDFEKEKDIAILTQRELEILKLWGEGYPNQKIAEKLFISIRTVETHKNHIMQKLNLKSVVDLVKFAIRNNIIKI